MTLRVKPLHPLFAAEAEGIDLRRPPGANAMREIEAAMDRHAVLVLRGQTLTEDEQIAFARAFGPLDLGLKKALKRANRLKHDESIDISNVDDRGVGIQDKEDVALVRHAYVAPSVQRKGVGTSLLRRCRASRTSRF